MATINSEETLEAWLQDKPDGWGVVIAHRAALRVLPIVPSLERFKSTEAYLLSLANASFRVNAVTRGSVTCSEKSTGNREHEIAINGAVSSGRVAAYTVYDRYYGSGAANPGIALLSAVNAADAAGATADHWNEVSAAGETAKHAVLAAGAASGSNDATDAEIWTSIQFDCDELERGVRPIELLELPLWQGPVPQWIEPHITSMESRLRALDQGFGIWIDWYRRRIAGDPYGFGLAGGEQEISIRLIEATDRWWKREPALVNRDIQSWISELASDAEPSESAFVQNPYSENFSADNEGRIGISPPLSENGLIADEDARRFHQECRREIESAIEASSISSTQATDVLAPLQGLLEAVGEAIERANPQAMVTRLEKVRTLYDLRDAGDDMATPFTGMQKIEISSALKIGDAWIAFDAKLATIRDGTYGPDYPRTSVDPQTVRIIIEQAKSMGVARDDAHALIIDASTDVPAGAPKDDRRRITLGARFGNFIRATGRFIWTHKGKIAAGSVTGLGMAITFINKNAAMLTEMFASSPTLVEIIKWIGKLAL